MLVRWKGVVAAVVIGSLFVSATGWAETAAFVEIRGDSTVAAEAVAWRPADQVLLVFRDGSDRLVMVNKVRRITDTKGADRTRYVIDGRGKLGEYPPNYAGPPQGKNPWLKPVLIGLGVGAAFFLLLGVLFLTGAGTGTNP